MRKSVALRYPQPSAIPVGVGRAVVNLYLRPHFLGLPVVGQTCRAITHDP